MTRKLERGRAAEAHGRRSESLAAILLACKFYRVIGRRVKTRAGELDLIALSPSRILCFIEVKARRQSRAALESVEGPQRARIARAAFLYLAGRPGLAQRGARFDIVAIAPFRPPLHLRDVWRPDD
jgi:putative endonuclease